MPIVRTFTLPEAVVEFLDKLPSKEKSKYVSQTLLKQIEADNTQEALNALYAIKRVKDKDQRSSTMLIKEIRTKRKEQLLFNHQ